MRKIGVILSRFPYPLEKGDKLRAFHQLKELSQNYEVHLFCLTEHKPNKNDLKELSFCHSLEVFELSKWKKQLNLVKALFGKLPFQVRYFYHRSAQKKWDAFLSERKVDFIYCQMLRTAEYTKNKVEYSKTLDYQDVLSVGMQRMAKKQKWPLKWVYQWEAKRLKKYEHRMFNYFEHHTIISAQDRELIPHPHRKQIVVVPNGISESFIDCELKMEKQFDICFIGNLSYPPNIESCRFIFKELVHRLPYFKFLFSGANPSKEIMEMKAENLEIRSWVEDIRTSYLSSKILVAPMFISTGMQNKILESMALGIPCVTTPMANNAVNAKNGQEILLAETVEEFQKQIHTLLSDEGFYTKIQQQAQVWVRENYRWDMTTKILSESCFQDNEEGK